MLNEFFDKIDEVQNALQLASEDLLFKYSDLNIVCEYVDKHLRNVLNVDCLNKVSVNNDRVCYTFDSCVLLKIENDMIGLRFNLFDNINDAESAYRLYISKRQIQDYEIIRKD